MNISDVIAKLIEEMISDSDGTIEIQRNDLANKVGCVPSQINYVIMSRFTPERGYVIESRRGGGGFIRIIKKKLYKDEYLMHFFHAIGDEIDLSSSAVFIGNLYDNEMISDREKNIILIAMNAIETNAQRAVFTKQVILSLLE